MGVSQNGDEHATSNSVNMADGGLFPLMPQKAAQRRQQPPSPREASPSSVSLEHYYKITLFIY